MSSFLINLVMNAGLILIIVYIVNLLYFLRISHTCNRDNKC